MKAWLARHLRYHLHFTPTSASWLNQVERWFALLADKQITSSSNAASVGGGASRGFASISRPEHGHRVLAMIELGLAVHYIDPTPPITEAARFRHGRTSTHRSSR